MPQDSPSSKVHPDEGELPNLPRTTELLMKLRRKDSIISWSLMIPCSIYVGGAVVQLAVSGKDAFPSVIFWISMAALFFIAHAFDRQKRREKIVSELLGELVAENNHLRRLLREPSKNQG